MITLLAALVTITTWSKDPFLLWSEEAALFGAGLWACWRFWRGAEPPPAMALTVAAIGLWGFFQLFAHSTVARFETANAGLQNLALLATWLAGYQRFRTREARERFLRWFLGFSLLLSFAAVLSYWTSPGKILWIFRAQYADNWGPFQSRNNFAQFVELGFPVALARWKQNSSRWSAAIAPAMLLGAGLASASRAGAAVLLAEGACVLLLPWRRAARGIRGRLGPLVLASLAVAGISGAGVLLHRLSDPNPLQFRREIFRSTLAMLKAAPGARWLGGYGLGSFATVYPEFASFDSGAAVEHAHNDWLEAAVEGGLPYAGLWVALAVFAISAASRSGWGWGAAGVMLHALVDYPFARLGISVWVFLFLSALARDGEDSRLAPECEKSLAWEPLWVGGER